MRSPSAPNDRCARRHRTAMPHSSPGGRDRSGRGRPRPAARNQGRGRMDRRFFGCAEPPPRGAAAPIVRDLKGRVFARNHRSRIHTGSSQSSLQPGLIMLGSISPNKPTSMTSRVPDRMHEHEAKVAAKKPTIVTETPHQGPAREAADQHQSTKCCCPAAAARPRAPGLWIISGGRTPRPSRSGPLRPGTPAQVKRPDADRPGGRERHRGRIDRGRRRPIRRMDRKTAMTARTDRARVRRESPTDASDPTDPILTTDFTDTTDQPDGPPIPSPIRVIREIRG